MPTVLQLHGGVGNPKLVPRIPLRKVAKRIYDDHLGRWMLRIANCVISSDQFNADEACQRFHLPKEKIPVIHNGIDLTHFHPNHNHSRDKDILYVGDLEPWKGVNTLIEAFNRLHKQDNEFRLTIVGDGSLRHHLENYHHNSKITFLGQVPHKEIPTLMRNAYTLVLPSLWEGIPTVALEAMASKTPFIGTNIGGIPEIITHQSNGLLIPPKNPQAIINAILQLANHQLRTTIVENAHTLVTQKYSITTICQKLEHLYKAIIQH